MKTERSNEDLQVSPESYRDLDELNVPALDDLGRAVRTGQLLGLEDDENSMSPRQRTLSEPNIGGSQDCSEENNSGRQDDMSPRHYRKAKETKAARI